jgi:hypothetical protein
MPPRGGLYIHFGDAERDSVRDVHVMGGGAGSDIGTAIALLGSIKNPLSNQILMNAERPKLQGTAENYAEFKRVGTNIIGS